MKALELRQYSVKPLLRTLLRPVVSPRVVQSARFWWWSVSSYFPRVVISRFIKRTPEVRTFGVAHVQSHLAKDLQGVNAMAPTKMCRVMTMIRERQGSRAQVHRCVFGALRKSLRPAPASLRAGPRNEQSRCTVDYGRIWSTGGFTSRMARPFPACIYIWR